MHLGEKYKIETDSKTREKKNEWPLKIFNSASDIARRNDEEWAQTDALEEYDTQSSANCGGCTLATIFEGAARDRCY